MTSIGLGHIGELVTNVSDIDASAADSASVRVGELGVLHDAAVVVDDGKIAWIGTDAKLPATDEFLDAGGRAVIPAFVDSHTHALFAGDRSAEFCARMMGEPYTGGGIMDTVRATRSSSDQELRDGCAALLAEMRAQGTGVVEIKSGYGLDVNQEVRLCRIASELTDEVTFLGAHAVPQEYATDREGYVDLVCGPMMKACAPFAKWADVFCEPASAVAFNGDETRAVLEAARACGLDIRVHAAQLSYGPGVKLACEFEAASVDHCTFLSPSDIDALADANSVTGTRSGPVATFLPAVEFTTKQPYPNARPVLDAGIPVAIATDCNPGSCYSSSIPFALAVAVREMGFSPEEALWAATAGSALSLRRSDVGRIAVGCWADLVVLNAPTYLYLTYRPGVPLIYQTFFHEE